MLKSALLKSRTVSLLFTFLHSLRFLNSTISGSLQPRLPLTSSFPTSPYLLVQIRFIRAPPLTDFSSTWRSYDQHIPGLEWNFLMEEASAILSLQQTSRFRNSPGRQGPASTRLLLHVHKGFICLFFPVRWPAAGTDVMSLLPVLSLILTHKLSVGSLSILRQLLLVIESNMPLSSSHPVSSWRRSFLLNCKKMITCCNMKPNHLWYRKYLYFSDLLSFVLYKHLPEDLWGFWIQLKNKSKKKFYLLS